MVKIPAEAKFFCTECYEKASGRRLLGGDMAEYPQTCVTCGKNAMGTYVIDITKWPR